MEEELPTCKGLLLSVWSSGFRVFWAEGEDRLCPLPVTLCWCFASKLQMRLKGDFHAAGGEGGGVVGMCKS